jgi:tRNA G26 N,N-dimethylase Trm1
LRRYVIANDLSNAATEVMRKNVDINGFSEKPADPDVPGSKPTPAKVVVNEGDAWYCFPGNNLRVQADRGIVQRTDV